MPLIKNFVCLIKVINDSLAKVLSWSMAAMALFIVTIIVARSFFNTGSVALQESVTYLHATSFMLCLAYTAQVGGHVRVDIFYHRLNDLGQAWVNLIGSCVFLLPFSVFLLSISWPFAANAWSIHEGSINPGGIPAVYILKTIIPLSGALLLLRAIGEIIENLLFVSFIVTKRSE